MLCLCIYTAIIGHIPCCMLNITNGIALQKEWGHIVTNNVCGPKTCLSVCLSVINSQQVPKKASIKIFVRAGNPTRDYCFTCLVTWGTDSRTAERADGRTMANQYAALLPNKVVALRKTNQQRHDSTNNLTRLTKERRRHLNINRCIDQTLDIYTMWYFYTLILQDKQ